jgi:hypothetical protein
MHHHAEGLHVQATPNMSGHGVFAMRDFVQGEYLLTWGGRILTTSAIESERADRNLYVVQVEEDLHSVTLPDLIGVGDYVNHSCDPNAVLSGQITLIARRDIRAGEQVLYDNATTNSIRLREYEFVCLCGSPRCRGQVTAQDWRRPDLQRLYRGQFSPYLQRRIDAIW